MYYIPIKFLIYLTNYRSYINVFHLDLNYFWQVVIFFVVYFQWKIIWFLFHFLILKERKTHLRYVMVSFDLRSLNVTASMMSRLIFSVSLLSTRRMRSGVAFKDLTFYFLSKTNWSLSLQCSQCLYGTLK